MNLNQSAYHFIAEFKEIYMKSDSALESLCARAIDDVDSKQKLSNLIEPLLHDRQLEDDDFTVSLRLIELFASWPKAHGPSPIIRVAFRSLLRRYGVKVASGASEVIANGVPAKMDELVIEHLKGRHTPREFVQIFAGLYGVTVWTQTHCPAEMDDQLKAMEALHREYKSGHLPIAPIEDTNGNKATRTLILKSKRGEENA